MKKNARISVNKLAEYLEANSARRKKIVEDAKDPKKFITTRYKEARDGVKLYLPERDEDAIVGVIEALEKKEPENEFQQQDIALSAEALERLLDSNLTLLDGCNIDNYEDKNEYINVKGVDISVNPDLIVSKLVSDMLLIGALKIHISKTNILSEESQKIVGIMLYEYVERFVASHGHKTTPKLCLSFDVFQKRIEPCPNAIKLRMKNIEIACEEIALWWDKL